MASAGVALFGPEMVSAPVAINGTITPTLVEKKGTLARSNVPETCVHYADTESLGARSLS